MANYVEYQLEDGATLLIEIDDKEQNIIRAGRGEGNIIITTSKKFKEAIQSAKSSANTLLEEFKVLPVDEMDIVFGLKSTGEAGVFAVGKVGFEANFQVTLKWKNPS